MCFKSPRNCISMSIFSTLFNHSLNRNKMTAQASLKSFPFLLFLLAASVHAAPVPWGGREDNEPPHTGNEQCQNVRNLAACTYTNFVSCLLPFPFHYPRCMCDEGG
jgi:hypothetical protein